MMFQQLSYVFLEQKPLEIPLSSMKVQLAGLQRAVLFFLL